MTDLLDSATRDTVSAALLAYNAMETTKRRHFDYLNQLEAKREKFNLAATEGETDLLASLLADHNLAVNHFKFQSSELLRSGQEAHTALFSYIALLNETLNPGSSQPEH